MEKQCMKCGCSLSDGTIQCPNCGEPIKPPIMPTWLFIFICIFIPPVGIYTIWQHTYILREMKKKLTIIICIWLIPYAIIGITYNATNRTKPVENNISDADKDNIQEKSIDNADSKKESKKKDKGKKSKRKSIKIPKKYKNSFKKACLSCNMAIKEISNFKKLKDWGNGERYTFTFKKKKYIVYFLDNGKVSSINNSNNNKIYEKKKSNQKKHKSILLTDGELGDYGKEEDFSGYKMIRYYIPTGKYKVTCQTRGSGFYIETIEKHLEDGYETSDIIQQVTFSGTDEEYKITIKEGQCISLLINSILEFSKDK